MGEHSPCESPAMENIPRLGYTSLIPLHLLCARAEPQHQENKMEWAATVQPAIYHGICRKAVRGHGPDPVSRCRERALWYSIAIGCGISLITSNPWFAVYTYWYRRQLQVLKHFLQSHPRYNTEGELNSETETSPNIVLNKAFENQPNPRPRVQTTSRSPKKRLGRYSKSFIKFP